MLRSRLQGLPCSGRSRCLEGTAALSKRTIATFGAWLTAQVMSVALKTKWCVVATVPLFGGLRSDV